MEVRPGYKQTEVGVIPDDWDAKTLGDIGESLIGLTYKPTDVRSGGILVLRSSNIQEGILCFDDNVFVDVEVPERIMVRAGDILICVRNGSRDLIGKCARLDERANGMTFGAFMAVFRTPIHRFVYHQFESAVIKRQVHQHLGATINQITNKSLNSFSIPVPRQAAEQEAIADALSDADALAESLDQILAKKRQIKQGAMQELLTGKRRLPGFEREAGFKQSDLGAIPHDWEVATLSSLCSMKSGQGITSAKIDTFSGYPCYGGNGLRGFAARFTHDGRYALIGRQGALCGNVLGVEGKFFASEHAIVASASPQTDIRWLTFVLREMQLNQYSESSAQPGLSVSKLLSLEFARPTNKSEQEAISTVLADMDTEIASLEAKVAKARQLKQGMMQELLTGRIRLV